MKAQYAVVTGGTKGIGKALVEKLASEGFSVITCARHEADLQQLQEDIRSAHPEAAVFTMVGDLSRKEEVLAFVEFCHRQTGRVEVLVNNAGAFLPGQIHNEEEGTLEYLFRLNVQSAYYLTRGLMGAMMEAKQGHIFNLCSTASIMGYPNGGSYCITKHALHGLTRVLREELKPHGVRVTAVIPGATFTASWEGAGLPAERFMKPEDVAEAVWMAYSLSGQTVMEELLLRPQLGDI